MCGNQKEEKRDDSGTSLGLLYAAILIAIVTRIYHLGYQSIWGDESLTLFRYTSAGSLSDLLHGNWSLGSHPPLFFVIAYYWYKLGHSEFMLRAPAMIFGVASIPVAYALTNRLFERRTASIAALIVALSPIHIWYSQEARMYTLQVLLCLTSTLYFVKALQENRAKDYVLYVLFTVMAFLTQLSTLILIASQALFAIIHSSHDRVKLLAWVWVLAQILLVCSPWLLNSKALHHVPGRESAVGFDRKPTVLDAGYVFYTFSAGFSLGPSVAELHELPARKALTEHWLAILGTFLIFGILVVTGMVEAKRRNRFAFWLLLAMMVIPALLLTTWRSIPIYPRYLLPSAIPYWIAIALGIRRCMDRPLFWSVPALAAMVTAMSLSNYYWQPDYAKQDVRSATMLINRFAEPGDIVVISSIEIGGPFIYYLDRHDVRYVGYPSAPGMANQSSLLHDMGSLLRHKRRAWLVLGRTWSSDPKGLIAAHFDNRYDRLLYRQFPGIRVSCYDLERGTPTCPQP